MAMNPGPWMSEENVALLRKLQAAGVLGGGVLQTDDCRRDYEDLKAKGVEFTQEPTEMPYGIEAVLRDDSGNFYSMTQRR
jgi:hypothetical protein